MKRSSNQKIVHVKGVTGYDDYPVSDHMFTSRASADIFIKKYSGEAIAYSIKKT